MVWVEEIALLLAAACPEMLIEAARRAVSALCSAGEDVLPMSPLYLLLFHKKAAGPF
jgi:hypothetical protein